MTLRVKILSPLTATADDLARRQRRYSQGAGPNTVVQVVNLEGGPSALDSAGDILISAAAMYRQGASTLTTDFDAILIDCVFDPAVRELREATGLPVFGPTQTTLPLISLVAPDFSIIARSRRHCELLAQLIEQLGFGGRIRSLQALDISYEEAKQPTVFKQVMAERLSTAVVSDGARAILFGSTTMALDEELREAARGVPLFMPGLVALRVVELLWQDGLWSAG